MKRIDLISQGWNYDSTPEPGVEIRQEIHMEESGEYLFQSFVYDKKKNLELPKRKRKGQIPRESFTRLFRLLKQAVKENCFEHLSYIQPWKLTLMDSDETQIRATGSMSGKVYADSLDMTEYIRDLLQIENCFVFNNIDREDIGFGCYCAE